MKRLPSELEARLLWQIRNADLPEPLVQHPYAKGRKLKADFAWPNHRLLVEVQGGIWTRQAHGSIKGVLADIDRGNAAVMNGWRLLRVTGEMVDNGEAVSMILEVITGTKGEEKP